MATTLFLIDPQNDFIDDFIGAALPVKGSANDMLNISDLLVFGGHKIDRVVITLDQHPPDHIAHPEFWVDRRGRHPAPFTTILLIDMESGEWTPADPNNRTIYMNYLFDAESAGVILTIWPPHCIMGFLGANIHNTIAVELLKWQNSERKLRIFNKSGNAHTEQFSSFEAAVPDPYDPSTEFNYNLLYAVDDYTEDPIYIAGEALSHCVAETIRSLIGMWENSGTPEKIGRLVLLGDCTSPVAGCEEQARVFVEEFQAKGGRVMKSTAIYEPEQEC